MADGAASAPAAELASLDSTLADLQEAAARARMVLRLMAPDGVRLVPVDPYWRALEEEPGAGLSVDRIREILGMAPLRRRRAA